MIKTKSILLGLIFFLTAQFVSFLLPVPAVAEKILCGAIPQKICDEVTNTAPSEQNPLGGFQPIFTWVIGIAITVFVVGAVFIIVLSGLQIAASAGNSEAISTAKKNITNAFTGIALLISFSAILSFVGIFDTGLNPPTTLLSNINFDQPGQILSAPINPIVQILLNATAITSFLTAMVSVIMIIVGGVRYIFQGTTGSVEGAKKTIQYAVGGLALSMMAYAIVNFVVNALIK